MAGNYDHSRPLETACPPCVLVGVGGWELLVTAGLIGGALAANDLQNQMTVNPDAGKGTSVTWTADDKIKDQMEDRGWTDKDIDAAIAAGATGTSIDKRKPSKTDDKLGRNDPATVYGKPGSYVVINDRTGEVVQVSSKTDEKWIDDSRIQWNKK